MARTTSPKRPGKQRGTAGRVALLLQGLNPLLLAWGLVLITALGAVGFFLIAYQEGGPRQGGGLRLALQALGGDTAEAAGDASVDRRASAGQRGPRVAVVVTGLGLAQQATRRAIDELPPDVALSFSPYTKDLQVWLQLAREKGHEVLLDLPMEPTTFPKDDPGPRGLMTLLDAEQNLQRLDWILTRGEGYVGVVASMGSRFITSKKDLEPVFKVLKARGLLFLDNGVSKESISKGLAKALALPHVTNDRALDDNLPNRALIQAGLRDVERVARARGSSIAIGQPYPATLESITEWAAELESRGLALATLSSLAGLPPPRQAQHQADKDDP